MRHLRSLPLLCAGALLLTGQSGIASTPAPSANGVVPAAKAANAPARMEWTDDGPILVTPKGMTLYTNSGDATIPGKSICSNVPKTSYADEQGGLGPAPLIGGKIHKSCAQKWPPFMADANAQPNGEFGLIDRPEGGKQWTYNAFPLYTSIRDTKPGERLGIGGGFFSAAGRGFRFAMVPVNFPAGLKLARRDAGLIFIASNTKPVYTPAKGHTPERDLFQPILAPALARVSGDWTIVDAGAGRRQYAFKGQPLYTAPESLKEGEIAESNTWQPVVFRKGPPLPPQIGTQLALVGDLYTDKNGLTLYTFNCNSPARDGVRCDDPGDPAGYWVALCGDAKECARRWRPYLATADARPSGLWTVVDVAYPMFTTNPGVTYPPEAPRVKAWAYRGAPVYTYYEDKEPGDMWGDGTKWIGGSDFFALRVPGRSAAD